MKAPAPTALEVQRLCAEATPKAIKRLIALVDSPNQTVALAAANALIDRGFGRPTTSHNVHVLHDETARAAERKTLRELIRARPELADLAREFLPKAELAPGYVVEAEAVEVEVQ